MFKTIHFDSLAILSEAAVELARDPHISLAIWPRLPQAELIQLLHAYVLNGGSDIVVTSSAQDLEPQITRALVQAGATRDPAWVLLHTEILSLSRLFVGVTEASAVEIELRVLTDAHCTRFHADYNHSRLLCTYLGPGTLWTPHHNVLWCQDENPPCLQGLRDPARVRQMPAFAVGLLKGRLHPHMQGYGQVHRSPELPPGVPYRLLLKIDQVVPA